jgi:hypothetical protein
MGTPKRLWRRQRQVVLERLNLLLSLRFWKAALAQQENGRRRMIDNESRHMTHRWRANPRVRLWRFASVKNDQLGGQFSRE